MVVNDLNLLWPRGGPPKTDPPLVVDSNAELTPPITFQRLEPVSRGNPLSIPQTLSVLVSERLDLLHPIPHNAKRQ